MSEYSKHVCKLSDVERFVGKSLNSKTSVAEHSYRVACIAMAIVDQYNIENASDQISAEEVIKKALLHDLEESITGDIPSPVKSIGKLREELRFAGETLLKEQVFLDCPDPHGYLKLWKQDKKGVTGEIITIADKLEGMMTSYFEVKNGNWFLLDPFISHLEWFKSSKGRKLLKKYTFAKKEFLDMASFIIKQKDIESDTRVNLLDLLKREIKEVLELEKRII